MLFVLEHELAPFILRLQQFLYCNFDVFVRNAHGHSLTFAIVVDLDADAPSRHIANLVLHLLAQNQVAIHRDASLADGLKCFL